MHSPTVLQNTSTIGQTETRYTGTAAAASFPGKSPGMQIQIRFSFVSWIRMSISNADTDQGVKNPILCLLFFNIKCNFVHVTKFN